MNHFAKSLTGASFTAATLLLASVALADAVVVSARLGAPGCTPDSNRCRSTSDADSGATARTFATDPGRHAATDAGYPAVRVVTGGSASLHIRASATGRVGDALLVRQAGLRVPIAGLSDRTSGEDEIEIDIDLGEKRTPDGAYAVDAHVLMGSVTVNTQLDMLPNRWYSLARPSGAETLWLRLDPAP